MRLSLCVRIFLHSHRIMEYESDHMCVYIPHSTCIEPQHTVTDRNLQKRDRSFEESWDPNSKDSFVLQYRKCRIMVSRCLHTCVCTWRRTALEGYLVHILGHILFSAQGDSFMHIQYIVHLPERQLVRTLWNTLFFIWQEKSQKLLCACAYMHKCMQYLKATLHTYHTRFGIRSFIGTSFHAHTYIHTYMHMSSTWRPACTHIPGYAVRRAGIHRLFVDESSWKPK